MKAMKFAIKPVHYFYERLSLRRSFPVSSISSPMPFSAPTPHVSLQSGWCHEDHDYREAAQDYPHYSEPNGRPPRFQCELKPPVALML